MLKIIHNYMNGIKTYLNNESIYLDKKSPAHLERNKLIKVNLNFNNLNFFECVVTLELPSFVLRNSVQTIFDTGVLQTKLCLLTNIRLNHFSNSLVVKWYCSNKDTVLWKICTY